MAEIVARKLTQEEGGIPGYIAHPARAERGPGLLLIHQHSGLTGYLKTEAYKFAKLGYCTVIPNLYHLLGYPAETHIHTGTEIQNKTPDGDFVRVIDAGWRFLIGRDDVDPARAGAIGYCMGGRIGIHFVAATPQVRAFVAYYPSVRNEQPTRIRPRHPCDAAREIKCPSMVFYGGHDSTSTIDVQQRVMESFLANGQPLEWHFFPRGNHGFASTESDGYQPELAELVWPLVVDFFNREFRQPAR
ncbi:MAG TPA: dienelactone hydrolase family protein [Candidatus Binatia bacterium]|jgi:carboxymethylenebutenolidase